MVSSANDNPKTLNKQPQRVTVLAAVDDLFSEPGMKLEDQHVFIQNEFHGDNALPNQKSHVDLFLAAEQSFKTVFDIARKSLDHVPAPPRAVSSIRHVADEIVDGIF
jgi:hypothetical protein